MIHTPILPQVDVVIPTLGRWSLLDQTIRHITSQGKVRTRIIVVNDSGHRAPRELGHRVEVISTEGRTGEGHARSVGLRAVTAPWVAFCDDDDTWCADKLTRQLQALRNRPGWSITGALVVDSGGQVLEQRTLRTVAALLESGRMRRRILTHNPILAGPSSILVDTALLRSVGGWDPRFRYFADWDLWIRLCGACDPVLVDEPLVKYRRWDGQMIADRSTAWAALDLIRSTHVQARQEHQVGSLDDRVILWILQGEMAVPGRRLAGARAAASRLRPERPRDLLALVGHLGEAAQRVHARLLPRPGPGRRLS